MKTIYLMLASFSALASSSYGVTFGGTAVDTISNAVAGDSSFIVADTDGDGFSFGVNSVGTDFSVGSFLDSSDDFVFSHNAVASFFTTSVPGNASFTLGDNGLDAGTPFYIVVFGTQSGSSVTTQAGDTFTIVSEADWLIPNTNSANPQFDSAFTQTPSADAASLTIVPEPSTFAALAGLLAFSFAMARRRV